jgi:pimeloyl-ACP methyl ester carboxylesterase
VNASRGWETVALAYGVEGTGDPPCVLVHGITLSRDDLRPLAGPLSARHSVVSVDLRGHGQSPAGVSYEIEDLAADVRALADTLELRDAVVIGHSLGGLVALEVAATAPDRFDGLVIIDSSPAPQPEALAWLRDLERTLAGSDFETVWPEFCRTALFGVTATDELRDRVFREMGSASPEPTRSLVRSFNDYAEHRSLAALRACAMPILVIGSSSPTPDTRAVAEAAPQTVFAQVAASGHFLHHEVSDQLYAMIEHFVSNCVPRPEFARPSATGSAT